MRFEQLENLFLRGVLFLIFGVGLVRYLAHELKPEIRRLCKKWQERQKSKI